MELQIEHARAFLRALHPSPSTTRLVQFVMLHGREMPQQRWLWAREQESAVLADVLSWNAIGWDCYVGVNPRATMAGGERNNIAAVTALPVDFDEKKTGLNFARLEARIYEEKRFPQASIRVRSGNGVHSYWLLAADAEPDDAEEVCERLGVLFAGDDVWNASRIMRLPGTVNWKSPPTWCGWDHIDGARCSLAAIDQCMTEVGLPPFEEEPEVYLPLDVPPSLQEAVDRTPAAIRTIIVTGRADGFPSHSEADWAVACALFSAGCTTEQAMAVFRSYPLGGLKASSSPASYLTRTLARAKSQVARDLAAKARMLALPQPPFAELSPGRFAIRMTEAYDARHFWR